MPKYFLSISRIHFHPLQEFEYLVGAIPLQSTPMCTRTLPTTVTVVWMDTFVLMRLQGAMQRWHYSGQDHWDAHTVVFTLALKPDHTICVNRFAKVEVHSWSNKCVNELRCELGEGGGGWVERRGRERGGGGVERDCEREERRGITAGFQTAS